MLPRMAEKGRRWSWLGFQKNNAVGVNEATETGARRTKDFIGAEHLSRTGTRMRIRRHAGTRFCTLYSASQFH